MIQKWQTIRSGSLKNLRNIYKENWSLVIFFCQNAGKVGVSQMFDLFKRTYFMDDPNSWKYYQRNFCDMCSFNGSNVSML